MDPAAHTSESPSSSSDLTTLKQLAISTYREVWREFYSWEPEECKQLATSLARTRIPATNVNVLKDIANAVSDLNLVVPEDEIEADLFTPHPTYEACAPTSGNRTLREDEVSEIIEIPFIPYADEPSFPVLEYAEDSDHFGWSELVDPDSMYNFMSGIY